MIQKRSSTSRLSSLSSGSKGFSWIWAAAEGQEHTKMKFSYKNNWIWQRFTLKVGDKSLIIHKSAYHLFSLLVSKRGLSALQTFVRSERELPLPCSCYKSDATQLQILITLSFTLLHNISIVITNNRLVSLLPIGSNLVIMSVIINTLAN